MLRILLISTVLLLGGCFNSDQKAEHERTEVKLHVHLFDNQRDLNKYINSNFEVSPATRSGFSRWWKPDPTNECHIYVVRGLKSQEVNYGHELQHCIYGSFHKEQ